MIGCDGRSVDVWINAKYYNATTNASARSFGPTAEGSPSDWTR